MQKCLTLLVLVSFAGAALGANVYGHVELVEGTVTILAPDGKARTPRVDDTIYEGESIVTGKDGELQARTDDYGILAVRPGSSIKIDEFRARGDAQDVSVLRLLDGAIRSVSGWIGKYQAERVRIRVKSVTIGIRGTDHEAMVIEAGNPAGPPGIYDKVNSGGTYLENASGRVDVAPNKAGFAPHDGKAPSLLDKVPDFIRGTKNEGKIEGRKGELEKEIEKRRQERQHEGREEREEHKGRHRARGK